MPCFWSYFVPAFHSKINAYLCFHPIGPRPPILYRNSEGAARLTTAAEPFLSPFFIFIAYTEVCAHTLTQTRTHTPHSSGATTGLPLLLPVIDVCYLQRLSHASRHADPRVGPGWPRDLWASCGHGPLMKPCVFHEVVLVVCVCVSTHLIC